jgi:hypothetical protein
VASGHDDACILKADAPMLVQALVGFYPEIADGCERVENFKSSLAVLRRILGLWRRSMYSNTSARIECRIGRAVNSFPLDQTEEALAGRIVPRGQASRSPQ